MARIDSISPSRDKILPFIPKASDNGPEKTFKTIITDISGDGRNNIRVMCKEKVTEAPVMVPLQHEKKLAEFKSLLVDLHALGSLAGLAHWDLETYMPQKALEARANYLSTVARYSHEIFTSEKMEELLKYLSEEEVLKKLSPVDKKTVEETLRDFKKAKKLPSDFVKELSETTTKAHNIWQEARKTSDFSKFAPILEKIISLKRKEAELVGYEGSPYNALLDDYERGMTTEKLDKLFSDLKRELVPIIKKIQESNVQPPVDISKKSFSHEKQMEVSKELLRLIGFDFDAGRIDLTTHPFCAGIAPGDTRITTRIDEHDPFSAISTALHEGGHGLYDQGMDEKLANTSLMDGSSLGMHESQSRLMENIVGRGLAFWKFYFPKLKEKFKDELKDVSLEDWFKLINDVRPSLIRVESDEVTYNLHIILRYEIEKALIEGKLAVQDLPKVWNEKMKDYLGITPACDADGVLQDVHWSGGGIGYFATYTLGNLYSAQIFNTAKKEIPNLEEEIEKGNIKVLREWLREKIHKHGKMFTTEEIIKQVTGETLNPKYFIEYIRNKFSKIYP